jgi:nitrate reductase assembly molybdenum cofactor insertion protein NarJ
LATNSPLAVTEKLHSDRTSNTLRSKKRIKHEELQKTLKDKFDTKRRDEVLQYLTAWKSDKAQWKFQKVKQMFIEKQIFNSEEIPDEIWPTALEYLSGSRDASKQALLKAARDMTEQLGAKEDGKKDAKYKRARKIVKTLE